MRPLKNFVQNKISAFQPKKFNISFLEVPNTNSKEISWKTKTKTKKTKTKTKTKTNKKTNKKKKKTRFNFGPKCQQLVLANNFVQNKNQSFSLKTCTWHIQMSPIQLGKIYIYIYIFVLILD